MRTTPLHGRGEKWGWGKRDVVGGMMAGDGGLFRTRPCGAGREMHLPASFILPARMPPDIISFVFLSGEFRLR